MAYNVAKIGQWQKPQAHKTNQKLYTKAAVCSPSCHGHQSPLPLASLNPSEIQRTFLVESTLNPRLAVDFQPLANPETAKEKDIREATALARIPWNKLGSRILARFPHPDANRRIGVNDIAALNSDKVRYRRLSRVRSLFYSVSSNVLKLKLFGYHRYTIPIRTSTRASTGRKLLH
jgi:hypothetical protein